MSKHFVFVSFLLFSCSSGLQRPESFAEKMSRYQSKAGQVNQVPELPVVAQLKSKSTGKRGPASVAPHHVAKSKINYSNKKLYFFTLQSQYHALVELIGKPRAPISSCPKFHSTFIEKTWEAKAANHRLHNYTWNKIPKDKLVFFPEVHLPLSRKYKFPKVLDQFEELPTDHEKQVAVEEALHTHVTKVYNELSELCEHGYSANYYAFENLLTHLEENKTKYSQDNINILLKTSIFSNHLLIESLRTTKNSWSQNSYQSYISEIYNRLDDYKAKEYFSNYVANRKNLNF